MSLQINTPAKFKVVLDDGRELVLDEEGLQCAWSFGHGGIDKTGDIGEFINFLKWLAEQFGGHYINGNTQK